MKIDGETSSVESQMAAPSSSIADMPPPDSKTEVVASETAVNDDEDEHDDLCTAVHGGAHDIAGERPMLSHNARKI